MQKPRKSRPGAKAGPTPAQQEEIFQAASAGISITQDASLAVGNFLTAAIAALQTNMQTILQPNDATDPPGQFLRAMTGLMIQQLTNSVAQATIGNPGQAEATDARSGGSSTAHRSSGAPITPPGAAESKGHATRPYRARRRRRS